MRDKEMRRRRLDGCLCTEIPLLMMRLKHIYLIASVPPGERCESLSGTQSLCPPGLGFQSPLISEAM